MMTTKRFFYLSLTFIVSVTFLAEAEAQFKRFKSRTEFRSQNNKSDAGQGNPPPLNALDSGSGEDAFGRATGISGVSTAKTDKKYVNLNPETAFGPEVVTSFDFPDTSLVDLTKHMQKLTGINLILDKDLKGKVSIMAPEPITVGDAWRAYLTALNVNGYTLVKSGAFYKIVSAREVRYFPTKMYTGNYTPNTDNYVMRVIPLKNINSGEVSRSFRPFMSRNGRIIDIKQTNTIIIQETGSNINRLMRLIGFIDVPGHEESLQIIPVKHSSAQEIAGLLDKILKSQSSSKFRSSRTPKKTSGSDISKIIAEPRTNSIIAMANADGAKKLRSLIKKLDVRLVASSSGQIHVYYLNYGDAETLSKTLSTLVTGQAPKAKKGSSRFTRRTTTEENTLFNGPVKITADKDNNAIVVTASPTDYLTIKEVIKKLDIPRDQVYVEGLIMETQVTHDTGFGITIVGSYGSGGVGKAGFTGGSSDLLAVLTNQVTSLGGLFVGGGAGKTVTQTLPDGSTVDIKTVTGLITAIAADNNTNVLATPQILALDNTEAVFEVGEEVPTPVKTDAANGSSSTSVQDKKVTLKLKITPQINKVTRFIKLKIDQNIQDFSSRELPAALANAGVATTTRSAVTTVVVRDRDTIAMGGLMRDKEVSTEKKVPLLGDIPVLGWLFKNRSKSVAKVNMLFFLTPKIISAYGTEAAKTLKDVLNRRSSHLKEAFGDDDPFASTVKGMYSKAKKQESGPLYDKQEASRYKNENEKGGIDGSIQQDEEEGGDQKIDEDIEFSLEDDGLTKAVAPPNYNVIVNKVKMKQSSTEER